MRSTSSAFRLLKSASPEMDLAHPAVGGRLARREVVVKRRIQEGLKLKLAPPNQGTIRQCGLFVS